MRAEPGSASRWIRVALLAAAVAAPQVATAQIGLYHTYAETLTELQTLQSAHPTRAKLISIGHGWELIDEFTQRQIWALKISDNVTEDEGEPEVVFLGAHHAREWVSVELPLAIANHLLSNYASDPSIREIVDNKVVWVVPMVNPDGHNYSVTTDRCWRKNRRNSGGGAFGVDLNRNYGYQWGGAGSSSNPSDYQTYRGPYAFSEPETQAVRDFLRSRPNVRALVTYHSYTQAVLRPWSYTLNFTAGSPPPPGELMLKDLSDNLRSRIQAVHGETYKDCIYQQDRLPSGRCSPPHYAASGETTDWVYHELNIPAFTIELRPRNGSLHPAPLSCPGFELPDSQIAPTVQENLPAALALIRNVQPGKILIRDHATDTGVVPSSTLTSSGWNPVFWFSPDISSSPTVPVRGSTATLTARVHNLTSTPLSDVTVEIWYSDPSVNLEFPSPLATKLGDGTVPLGPGGSNQVSVPWPVPAGPNAAGDYHWCVGAVVKHADDLPASTQALYSSNVAHHNFTPVEALAGATTLSFLADNLATLDADFDMFVTSEGLPEGAVVSLDPDRPTMLAAGQRYVGFAELLLPEGVESGEGTIQIQGALTPRRPGAVNAVGSGIEYQVAYGPAAAPGRGVWLSLHLGYGFPVGSFNRTHDPGPGVTIDLEGALTDRLSLVGLLGYHTFHAEDPGVKDLGYAHVALDIRGYFGAPPWRAFVQGGVGFYAADPGPDEPGLNVGGGLEFPLQPRLALELGLDAHWIDPSGLDRVFLEPRLGIKFRP